MAGVQIKAQIVLVKGEKDGRIKLSAVGVKACSRTVHPIDSANLYGEFSRYKKWLIETHGVIVDPVVPNLYAMFWESRNIPRLNPFLTPKAIATVVKENLIDSTFCTICGKQFEPDAVRDESMVCHMQCAHPPLEVNMMEPLVGWKGWNFRDVKGESFLVTNSDFVWNPNVQAEATCTKGCSDDSPPGETCTCGIYAADDRNAAYQGIQGEIYGWGRYIRGDAGWRAQYAYPKNFYISDSQMQYFEFLKTFHVPIFIMQPMRMYSPEDDGYVVRFEREGIDQEPEIENSHEEDSE